QSVAHERVLLSPFLSRDHAAWVNPAMVLVSLAADQLSAPTSAGSAISPEPSDPGLKQVPSNLEPSNSVHPSQTVNGGIKDGIDRVAQRPKPFHSSRSSLLHTDTLSVSGLKTGIPEGSHVVQLIPETHCPAVGFLLSGRPVTSRRNPGQQKIVVVYVVV
ncbi:hypothetical protein, partial [Synechococcus sp. BA-132 BA5]|uniref:hypothetical protein n=1 Tax=Synechococcus sp. BA-132 BA5 TaxID=3110252 RepID=UPI002B1F04FF